MTLNLSQPDATEQAKPVDGNGSVPPKEEGPRRKRPWVTPVLTKETVGGTKSKPNAATEGDGSSTPPGPVS